MRYSDRGRNRNRGSDKDRERKRIDGGSGSEKRNRSGTSSHQDFQEKRGRPRRRRRRDFPRRPREQRRDWPSCPICERPVQELTSAINHMETGNPAHFDCIMKNIEAQEGLASNERICYLGKGSFGILRFQKNGGTIPFIIRKRIQYENIETAPEWRKSLDRFSDIDNREKQRYKMKAEKLLFSPKNGKSRT